MAIINNAFDSYQIFYYSGAAGVPTLQATIQLYQVGVFVGQLNFYDGVPPANGTIAPLGTDVPSINYALSRFKDVIETLRSEKPLMVLLDTNNKLGRISTSDLEPVGEEEGK